MSKNIELVNKALALLNDVPFGKSENEVVLVVRELKASLLGKEAIAPVVATANAPIIKLDDVEVVRQRRGRKPGSKVVKAKKSEVAAVPLEDSIVGEVVETLAQKAKKLKG